MTVGWEGVSGVPLKLCAKECTLLLPGQVLRAAAPETLVPLRSEGAFAALAVESQEEHLTPYRSYDQR